MTSSHTSKETLHPSELGYRWVMLTGLWLVYASFGMILGAIPPLVVYISADLNLTRSGMGSILGAWPLVYIGFAMPAGALIDRLGLRTCLSLGLGLIAVSGVLRAFAVNHVTLFLAVAIFGLGGPFISIGAPKMIGEWFNQKERGIAMGIYMTAPAVGRMIALSTANSVLMPLYDGRWRLAVATYGGIALLIAVVWWAVARDHESTVSPSDPKHGATSGFRTFPELLKIRVVRIVLLMSFGSFLFSHGFSNWLPEILRTGGMTAEQAGLWATLPAAIGIVATVVIPRLAIPSRRTAILVLSFVAAGASTAIVAMATGTPLVVGLILAGVAGRGVMPVLMLTLMDSPRVGPLRMGSAGGLYFTAGEVGGVLGPLFIGAMSDITGDFQAGLLTLTGSSLCLAVLAVWLAAAVRERHSQE